MSGIRFVLRPLSAAQELDYDLVFRNPTILNNASNAAVPSPAAGDPE